MGEQKPKIMAESLEEFQKIEKKLQELPACVLSQISTAQKGILGIECDIRNSYGDTQIALPPTTQISEFDEFIGVYSHDFFFRIPKAMKKYKLTYVFVNELNRV
jgi:hypothetical protein